MGKTYTELKRHALAELEAYMDSMEDRKGEKLAYWVQDYVKMLQKEKMFNPEKQIKYKRGTVVKAHLGYRIGCEEGGLHYAIVIDKYNDLHSPTATIIPLTSVKKGTDLSRLHRSKIYLGDELYELLSKKLATECESVNSSLQEVIEKLDEQRLADFAETDCLDQKLGELQTRLEFCQKMKREIAKMHRGSIAHVGQIVTISKIRIYDPVHPKDVLTNIRVSAGTLDRIDQKVQELYGGPQR